MTKKHLALLSSLIISVILVGSCWYYYRRSPLPYGTDLYDGFGGTALLLQPPKGSQVVVIPQLEHDNLVRQLTQMHALGPEGTLPEQTILILNGALSQAPTDRWLRQLTDLMRTYPYRLFYLRGEQEKAWLIHHPDQSLLSLFTICPVGVYVFFDDTTQPPIRISPQVEGFERLVCHPIENKEAVRGLCTLGEICSFAEGAVSEIILSTEKTVRRVSIT